MRHAILISFTVKTNKLSKYETSKFFRLLYGWKQIVCTPTNRYEYKRAGLLDSIPHIKVDQSTFIVPEEFMDEIIKFFDRWMDKVIFKTFKVLLEEEPEW